VLLSVRRCRFPEEADTLAASCPMNGRLGNNQENSSCWQASEGDMAALRKQGLSARECAHIVNRTDAVLWSVNDASWSPAADHHAVAFAIAKLGNGCGPVARAPPLAR